MYKVNELSQIILGRQGENNATTIEIDVSEWLAEYPNATINILAERNGDTSPYIAVTSVADGILRWVITESDTALSGRGKAEIRATIDDVIKKSAVAVTIVIPSLEGEPTPTPPEPAQSWVDEVLAAAEGIENMSATAEVDNNVGTPSVTVTKTTVDEHTNLDFSFKNLKGAKGDDGTTPDISANATVDSNVGTPSVEVTKLGTTENPSFAFAFHNLKGQQGADGQQGEQGETGATPNISMSATVDSNVGTPSVEVTKSGTAENPSFALMFSNLKGETGATPDMSNYYTKSQTDTLLDGKISQVAAEWLNDNVSDLESFGKIYQSTTTGYDYTQGYFYIKKVEPLTAQPYWDRIDVQPHPTVDQTYDPTSANAQSGIAVAGALATKQDTLTAGTNITIQNNVISATGGTSENWELLEKYVVGYSALTGATAPTFEADTYYENIGTNVEPIYTVLTTEPADWSTNWNNYFSYSDSGATGVVFNRTTSKSGESLELFKKLLVFVQYNGTATGSNNIRFYLQAPTAVKPLAYATSHTVSNSNSNMHTFVICEILWGRYLHGKCAEPTAGVSNTSAGTIREMMSMKDNNGNNIDENTAFSYVNCYTATGVIVPSGSEYWLWGVR